MPANRLVQLTLVGAVLTAVVAVGLAFPGSQTAQTDTQATDGQLDASAPTPNASFTPAVSNDGTHDEYEEHEEYADEDDEETSEDDEKADEDAEQNERESEGQDQDEESDRLSGDGPVSDAASAFARVTGESP